MDIHRSPTDKDESDTELALLAAVESGADALTFLGALGGVRVDHALSNVELLAHPALAGRPAWLFDEHGVRLSLLTAPDGTGRAVTREASGRAGDLVSLIPLGGSADGRDDRGAAVSARRRGAGPRPDARGVQRADRLR